MVQTEQLQTQQTQQTIPSPERDLRTALEAFETALTTPIIAGEVVPWGEAVVKAWMPAAEQVRSFIPSVHKGQYKEITSQDPEMLGQVAKLKACDAAILEQLDKFERHVQQVKQRGDGEKTPEMALKPLLDLLVTEGTKLVTDVKKQIVAVQTWYQEAFNRDRGVGD